MTFGAPKSVITVVKTTKVALIKPYRAPGSVTVQKMRGRGARSATAAS